MSEFYFFKPNIQRIRFFWSLNLALYWNWVKSSTISIFLILKYKSSRFSASNSNILQDTKRLVFMVVLLLSCGQVVSQNNETVKNEVIDRLLESIAEQNGDEADYTNLVEWLDEYFYNPLNINTATKEDLEKLVIVDETQILELQRYIEIHGPLLSIYELPLVKGWNKEDVFLILPFIKVVPALEEKKRTFKNYLQYGKHEMLFRFQQIFEEQSGFIKDSLGNSDYLGSPQQLYFRYRYSHSEKYSFGLTAKKDRGEEFFSGNNSRGFDFYSGHILVKKIWKFNTIALGDFQMQVGQGINFWKGYGFRKSAFSTSIMRNSRGLGAYTSANSNNYLRGGGFEFEWWKFTLTSFFSYDLKDATVDSTQFQEVITSISNTGLHRTNNEINKRERFSEMVIGNYLQFKQSILSVGAGVYYTKYNLNFQQGSQSYDQYDFTGNYQLNGGFDYKLRIGNVFLFGEMGLDKNFNYALIQGLETSVNGFHFSMSYRDYSKGYNNYHSNAFGENSLAKNERGFYLGMQGALFGKFSFTSYFDIYQFPWLRYNVDAPSWGFDQITQINYVPSYNADLYLRYKLSRKAQNSLINDIYTEPQVEVIQHNIRLHGVFKVLPSLSLRSRIEGTFIARPDANFRWGFLIYQDVNWQPKKVPISTSARFAIFRTDDFDTRLYAYENDLLYNFSVPFYYNKGIRWYINFTYKPVKGLSIAIRCSQFIYPEETFIGSGYDLINGITKTEMKIQVRYRFGNIHRKTEKAVPEIEETND